MGAGLEIARRRFEAHFGFLPELTVRAPGRVNLIGEHTDYNEGFVLPMAIERETLILARRRNDGILSAYAANFERAVETSVDLFERNASEPWIDYIVGVAYELAKLGKPLSGVDMMIMGNVPIGAGLSSSASLEMAALVLFERLGGFELPGADAPKLGRRVENLFLGIDSGIMDQFIIRMAKAGHALFLDCRTHEFEQVPVAFPAARFVIADTGVSRGLSGSKYNERVAECHEAVAAMRGTISRISATHLRDFALSELMGSRNAMSDTAFRRARHVITENARTLAACNVMRTGDVRKFGDLMNASDESLRLDYEATCPELDAMTAIARSLPGCSGSRMTGAGFGGCTVSLVADEAVPGFIEALTDEYRTKTGLESETIISAPAPGAGALG